MRISVWRRRLPKHPADTSARLERQNRPAIAEALASSAPIRSGTLLKATIKRKRTCEPALVAVRLIRLLKTKQNGGTKGKDAPKVSLPDMQRRFRQTRAVCYAKNKEAK